MTLTFSFGCAVSGSVFLTCACFYSGFFSLHGRTGDILGFNFLSLFAFIYSILDLMCVWSCGGYGGALRWV